MFPAPPVNNQQGWSLWSVTFKVKREVCEDCRTRLGASLGLSALVRTVSMSTDVPSQTMIIKTKDEGFI